MGAQATFKLSLEALLTGTVDIGTVQHALAYGPAIVFDDGTGASQINQVFADTRTLAASATEDLDLAGGLTNALGATVTFTKVRALIIRPAATNTNNVLVGGASSNQFSTPFGAGTHTVTVRPGGLLALVAPDATGYVVTAGTGDLLKLANSSSGTGVTYDIVILGTA